MRIYISIHICTRWIPAAAGLKHSQLSSCPWIPVSLVASIWTYPDTIAPLTCTDPLSHTHIPGQDSPHSPVVSLLWSWSWRYTFRPASPRALHLLAGYSSMISASYHTLTCMPVLSTCAGTTSTRSSLTQGPLQWLADKFT